MGMYHSIDLAYNLKTMSNKTIARAIEEFELQITWKLNNSYQYMIQDLNETLNKITQNIVLNSEQVENSIKLQINGLKLKLLSGNLESKKNNHSFKNSAYVSKGIKIEKLPIKLNNRSRQLVKQENGVSKERNIHPGTTLKGFDNTANDDVPFDDGELTNVDEEKNFSGQEDETKDEFPLSSQQKIGGIKSRIKRQEKFKREACYACPECSYSTDRKDSLKKHIDTVHRKIRSFECGECGDAFTQSSNLNTHIKRKH